MEDIGDRAITAQEFHNLVEGHVFNSDERLELTAGRIVRTPFPPAHKKCAQRVSTLLMSKINAELGEEWTVKIENSLPLDQYNELQPNIVVLRESEEKEGFAVQGRTVALVLEVVDDKSFTYVHGTKVLAYAKAGIPEVWVINLQQCWVHVYSQPFALVYCQATIHRRDARAVSHTLLGISIRVKAIFEE